MKTLIYTNLKGKTHMYLISNPQPHNIFGNQKEGIKEKGFKARVENRNGEVRSFRYDGIVALA